MKWFILVIVLILGGMLYYNMVMRKPTGGTPAATARKFVDAALAGDMAAIRAICADGCVKQAEKLARDIQAARPDPMSFNFTSTEVDEPRRALTFLFSGQPVIFEFLQEGTDWKIVAVGM